MAAAADVAATYLVQADGSVHPDHRWSMLLEDLIETLIETTPLEPNSQAILDPFGAHGTNTKALKMVAVAQHSLWTRQGKMAELKLHESFMP